MVCPQRREVMDPLLKICSLVDRVWMYMNNLDRVLIRTWREAIEGEFFIIIEQL